MDYQAAKPIDPEVVKRMQPYFSIYFGNPSSLHRTGDIATEALEKSRNRIARFIGAKDGKIIFTSGATESNNLALIGTAKRNRNKGKHIIISEIEHISIHNIAKYLTRHGFEVSKVPVDSFGIIRLDKLEKRIREDTILVSVAYANNEIGSVQSIREIGEICREHNIIFHSDAVAAEGLLDIDVERDKIDLLTLSSNDIYGPKGLGALYIRKGVRVQPIIIGGGQEFGLRSGSENLHGIVGMGFAADLMKDRMYEEIIRFKRLRDKLLKQIPEMIPKTYINGPMEDSKRLPNNAHFRFEAIEGESILLSLKDHNIAVSTGSACSSKTLEPSHTLIATGLVHEEAHGSMEVTVGRFTEEWHIDKLIEVLPGVVSRLRDLSPLWEKD